MTQEEKLLKLLQVAVENGWQPTCRLQEYIIYQEESFEIKSDGCVSDYQIHEEHKSFSLNDLVINWEEGKISFLQALCLDKKCHITTLPYKVYRGVSTEGIICSRQLDYVPYIRKGWILRPTSKRLEFLFEVFSQLLKSRSK